MYVNDKIRNSFVGDALDLIDSCALLPDELVLNIFSNFNLASLRTMCFVSKEWKRLANEPKLWKMAIHREIAFGNDKWAECGGGDLVKDEDSVEEFSSLPFKEFIEDCQKFNNIFPEKIGKDRLMLVRIVKNFTEKNLDELAKKYFSKKESFYKRAPASLVEMLSAKPIDKSHWVIMTTSVLPGSINKSYSDKENMITELSKEFLIGYEIPDIRVAIACIMSQYFNSKISQFSNNPMTNTSCKNTFVFQPGPSDEKITSHLRVGGFSNDGLVIGADFKGHKFDGIAPVRKF